LLFDCFFLSRVSIRWSFLRLKADFSSWESLYLIGLNPNRSKVWILASHLFALCIFNTWKCILSCNFTPTNIKVYIWTLKNWKKVFLYFGQTLMDDHKLVMISIFGFFFKHEKDTVFFSWKICLEKFRIWLCASKYIFSFWKCFEFFFEIFWRKPGILIPNLYFTV